MGENVHIPQNTEYRTQTQSPEPLGIFALQQAQNQHVLFCLPCQHDICRVDIFIDFGSRQASGFVLAPPGS